MPADLPFRPDADNLPPAGPLSPPEIGSLPDGIPSYPDSGPPPEPTITPPPTPHPAFGLAVLFCFLFLLMTQVFPAIGISIVLVMVELAENGLQALSKPGVETRLQERSVLPAFIASQVMGILTSCVVLRLLAGRGWTRQIAWRRPGFWQLIITLVGFPSLPILASGAYQLAKDFIPGIRELPAFLWTQLIVLLTAWLLLYLLFGRDWGRRLGTQTAGRQLGLVSVGLTLVLVAGVLVYQGVKRIMPIIPYDGPPLMEAMVEYFRNWQWWLAVLVIGVGPGLSEELWCRGLLGRGLVGRYGVVLGALLTSYLFGLIHIEPHQGTMAVLMGLVLHFSYLMTRSLWVPMLLHFLNNSLSVLALHLSSGKEGGATTPLLEMIDKEPQNIPLLVYAASGLLMLAAGWAFYRSRARLVARQEGVPAWQPPFPGVAHPPPDSGTVVVRPGPGLLPTLALAVVFALFAVVFYLASIERLPGQ